LWCILDPTPTTEVRAVAKREKYVLTLKLEGPGIRSGAVPVPELLRICGAVQDAVNRQAAAMHGDRPLRPGPITTAVHEECTLELAGIKRGSAVLPFRLAKPQHEIPELQMGSFGIDAIEELVSAIETLGTNGVSKSISPGVLDSLKTMGEVFDKKTVTKITWQVPKRAHYPSHKLVFDKYTREQVARLIKAPTHRPESIEGTLEMADFKPLDHRCRVSPLLGKPVTCTFDSDKEGEVQDLLRKPVRVTGQAKINPNSGQTEEIHISQIEILDRLLVGAKEFFASKSLTDLAKSQGVKPLANPSVLIGGWPADENIDEFLEQTYKERSA
jgi:hypothetical protein